jgi:hypothetical protein
MNHVKIKETASCVKISRIMRENHASAEKLFTTGAGNAWRMPGDEGEWKIYRPRGTRRLDPGCSLVKSLPPTSGFTLAFILNVSFLVVCRRF